MALTIPETIPSTASQGEQRLFSILKTKLPKDFIVWYEPRLQGNLYPDFTILSPTFGLLIIEVKGWFAGNIVEAGEQFFKVKGKQGIESYQSPLRQAHGYFCTAAERFKGYPILRQLDGNYEGKLVFPVGTGAVMSNINEPQAHEENIYNFLQQPHVAYRDELLEWENYTSEMLVQRLRDMFKVYFDFPSLTVDQVNTIKGCLHPETVIREKPVTSSSVPEGVELPVGSSVVVPLDIDQERLARNMKDGHRLISGVAGSGKTLILLARAKVLANRLFDQRILILCFNITLAAHLRSLLHGDTMNPQYQDRIEVMHFHDWARAILGRLPYVANQVTYDALLGEKVLATLQQRPEADRWDSILVDEAHTFTREWFECCVAGLKDPENGDLVVVSDGNQSLYKRSKFTWKSVGIKAQGRRTMKLAQNYRNTKEILEAAWTVVKNTDQDLTDDATFPTVMPEAALRQGPRPTLYQTGTKAKAVDVAVEQVQRLVMLGYSPSEIAILYRYKPKKNDALFNAMLKRLEALGLPVYWVTESQETKVNYSARRPGVRVITTLSSLGLEFKAVLLLWVEQFEDCFAEDLDERSLARRQLYVAMTRAQDELHLIAGGNAAVVNALGKSDAVDMASAARSTASAKTNGAIA
ncbi:MULTISPECIES: 3'-5' exonuclease [Cyanophyceae]|uniref:DEAD/DEAH box helicase n=1 Tax=Cyanophyceae TaxID=3028117 RepID=UPI001686F131|nr:MULTISPECIES: 3'-5' exonuclease [Cyanophyceae]MBD1918319.1 NERD domain-containing protein [Phormidium sp. FACHB-77]MBD2028835.1 NERD domain-containing protein [Phormidium sp. FACHB-322]MBD2051256.1 NERD domain-containing protein [Leptolyngbya sp. FACHB-60]